MLFGEVFLSRHGSQMAAYNALQVRLLRRYLLGGGTVDEWCRRMAPAFRVRYGWMMDAR